MNNYNTAICIVGICLVITALVIFINHLRTKKTIDRIENMLNEAAKGNFSEKRHVPAYDQLGRILFCSVE